MSKIFPYFCRGRVVKGFGRGSKELGIPTANLPNEVVNILPDGYGTGIYYGWASIDCGQPHKMVMSVGWNPFYENKRKSMEVHIMHRFKNDFYDSMLSVIVLGYLRPEKNFGSLEELVKEINMDIEISEQKLSQCENEQFQNHNYLKTPQKL